jgi:hypothetical protein
MCDAPSGSVYLYQPFKFTQWMPWCIRFWMSTQVTHVGIIVHVMNFPKGGHSIFSTEEQFESLRFVAKKSPGLQSRLLSDPNTTVTCVAEYLRLTPQGTPAPGLVLTPLRDLLGIPGGMHMIRAFREPLEDTEIHTFFHEKQWPPYETNCCQFACVYFKCAGQDEHDSLFCSEFVALFYKSRGLIVGPTSHWSPHDFLGDLSFLDPLIIL